MRFHGRSLLIGLAFSQSLLGLEIDSDFADAKAPKHFIEQSSQSITLDMAAPRELRNDTLSSIWYFRVRDLDHQLPLTLRITGDAGVNKIYYTDTPDNGWHEVNAESTTPVSRTFRVPIREQTASLLLADQPPLGTATWAHWIDSLKQTRSYLDAVTALSTNEGTWVPIMRISEGDKVDARRLAIILDTDPQMQGSSPSWSMLGLAKWLLGDDLNATWLRQNCELIVLPTLPSAFDEVLCSIKTDERHFLHVRFTSNDPGKRDSTASFLTENIKESGPTILIELPAPPKENFVSFYEKFGETVIQKLAARLQSEPTRNKTKKPGGTIHPAPGLK